MFYEERRWACDNRDQKKPRAWLTLTLGTLYVLLQPPNLAPQREQKTCEEAEEKGPGTGRIRYLDITNNSNSVGKINIQHSTFI